MRNHVLVRECSHVIAHSGRLGMKWGVRNGPPYPIDAKSAAANMRKKAETEAKKITADVRDAAKKAGGTLRGLENQLKTEESIERKISKKAGEKGLNIAEAANSIKDAVRYTVIAPSDDYVRVYENFKKNLSKKGYTETDCKNYFDLFSKGKVKHKAVQSNFSTDDGYEFEVQFHTPESQAAKDKKLPLYNERRQSGITEGRARELERMMEELAMKVPDPKGIENIQSHDGHLAHHGRKGQKWGVMNGPPYPLDRKAIVDSQYSRKGNNANPNRDDSKMDTTFRLKSKPTSREEDMRVANPLRWAEFPFNMMYSHMNCTCCTTAYDLRRRGYDVVAEDPFPEGIGDKELQNFYYGMDTTKCYFHESPQDVPKKTSKRNSDALAKWMKKEILKQGNGARGMILIDTPEWSHAFNYENAGGDIKLLDAQSNREYTMSITGIAVDAAVVRLDDKEPNYRYLKEKGVVRDA